MSKGIIYSAMQATGNLHLGNYLGALQNLGQHMANHFADAQLALGRAFGAP